MQTYDDIVSEDDGQTAASSGSIEHEQSWYFLFMEPHNVVNFADFQHDFPVVLAPRGLQVEGFPVGFRNSYDS